MAQFAAADSIGLTPPAGQALQQPDVLESLRNGVQRTLTAHTLFFDILSEPNTEARDIKMQQLASYRRSRDLDSAESSGSTASISGQHLGGHVIGKDGSTGRNPAPRSCYDIDTAQFTLKDAEDSKLLRDLCGDMYIDPSRLDA